VLGDLFGREGLRHFGLLGATVFWGLDSTM
jgi:hypothetical protein